MNTIKLSLIAVSILTITATSCKKNENSETTAPESETSITAERATDEISMAASQEVEGRKFVKTADINMEVNDVYESSIFIEKNLKDLDGFVTSSRLNARVLSENTYQNSDTSAMMVRKYQSENKMQVRIPTKNLGAFLTFINDKKVFLNSRIILAEDVTNNAKIAELEKSKLAKTKTVIDKMKNKEDKVERTQQNLDANHSQNLQNISLADNLKYSTVDIYLAEPNVRVAEIAITNTKGVEQKYRMNFLYDIKSALQEGFYLIQNLIIGLITIWPFLLIFGAGFYFWKRRSSKLKTGSSELEK